MARWFKTKKDKKTKYYSSTEIDNTGAVYRMIIGQRSNGKTYDFIKKVVDHWLDTNEPSAYVRRYAEDIQPANLAMLMNPFLSYIEKATKGEYNHVTYRARTFVIDYIDDTGKVIKKHPKPILYTVALNNWERSKGTDRGFVKYICFDEFMTRSSYLSNEFSIFANVLSSYIRDRSGTIIYMIANTVNKYCPYFEEMGLKDIEKQPQGTISLYEYNNKDLTVAVEYCAESTNIQEVKKYYAFDNPHLDMIMTGNWEMDSYPHLDYSVSKESCKFRFYVVFNMNMVIGEIHQDDYDYFLYFHPAGSNPKYPEKTDVVYTNRPTTKAVWMHSFTDVPLIESYIPITDLIKHLLRNKKDFYSSNSVGEIVRNFITNPYTTMERR